LAVEQQQGIHYYLLYIISALLLCQVGLNISLHNI